MHQHRHTPARRGLSTIGWSVALGVLLAVGVILLGWLLEPEPTPERVRHRDIDVTDLVTPDALTDEERENAARSPETSEVTLEDGAWVQVADASGRLEQQYSAERIDPLPDGWLEMSRPRAMIYLEGGRIITLRGEEGLVNVPRQAIESGTLEGDVVIRIFVPVDGRPVRIEDSEPEVMLRTDRATFDNTLGEVRCDGAIRIDAEGISFAGIGLSMLLGEGERTIERLLVEESTEPIRVQRSLQTSDGSRSESGDASDAGGSEPVRTDAASDRRYTLELERDVRIERYPGPEATEPETVLSGGRLTAVFSLDGRGLEGMPAGAPAGATSSGDLGTRVASMAVASTAQDDSGDVEEEGLVLIDYAGRLLMLPAPETQRDGSPDDVRVEIVAGDQPVKVFDRASEATITCDRLEYGSLEERLRLFGASARPLTVESPRLGLRGERFEFLRPTGAARFTGPGDMRLRSDSEAGASDADELEVVWSDGLDLNFSPGTEQLERALFSGEVGVDHAEFTLRSSSLDVAFAEPDAGQGDRVERIIARGGASPAVASRTTEAGRLEAAVIDLGLELDGDGRTRPATLRAEGAVRAEDAEQTLWAKALDVLFGPGGPEDPDGVGIEQVTADEGIRIRLGDGARVWADSLEGSGTRGTLVLRSPRGDLVMVRGNVVADQLRTIRFDERLRTARSGGPGRFRYYESPVESDVPEGAGSPPEPSGAPSMEVTWADLMTYDDRANDGDGAIELHGDVIVRNRPERSEDNDLDADRIRLDFARRDGVPVLDADGNPLEEDDVAAFRGSRDVRLLTADGEARLESRSWADEARNGEPDLVRITGPSITYDAEAGEGAVRGAGRLLVNRNPDPGSISAEAPADGAMGVTLGGDGTTRFSWNRRMEMVHEVASRYLVTMTDGVEILHAGVRPEDTLTLSAENLEVLMDRGEPQLGSDALDLGGRAEILRVLARGRVFVRTPGQDVECERFDYDAENQIALLTAREDRLVTVLSRGAGAPVRAESVTWDLRTGRIQITGAVGSAGQ